MSHHPTTAEILALENSLLSPAVRGGVDRLDELLADDFREFTASGAPCDRRACLESLPRQTAAHFEIEDFEARVLGPSIVLATYRLTRIDGGRARSLRSSIWHFDDGVWRLAFHQGTPTPDR